VDLARLDGEVDPLRISVPSTATWSPSMANKGWFTVSVY
jgi:hypothetical protein